MGIGFEQKELDRIFFTESSDYLKRNSVLPKASIQGEYELYGFTPIQADKLADLALKMLASSQAILTVINKNNLEIERQLKEKGIKF